MEENGQTVTISSPHSRISGPDSSVEYRYSVALLPQNLRWFLIRKFERTVRWLGHRR
jgi:hypothetical protein